MRRLFFFFILVLLTWRLQAQVNLIPNPGFENYDQCPIGVANMPYNTTLTVQDWFSPTLASPDYFHSCNTNNTAGVPVNTYSYQPARNGNGYAGLMLMRKGNNANEWHEYVETPLLEPLVAGQYYCFTYYLNAAFIYENNFTLDSVSSLYTDAIGVYVSKNKLLDSITGAIPVTPQWVNTPGNFITDTAGWVKLTGVYLATGGEKWLTIGNFSSDAATAYIEADPGAPANLFFAYVYIDDVSLMLQPTLTLADTFSCDAANFNIPLKADTGYDYLWSTGQTAQYITATSAGTYWVRYNQGCGSFTDTVVLDLLSKPTVFAGADTMFCPGSVVVLHAGGYTAGTLLQWSTGSADTMITVTQSGTYTVTATNVCGNTSDTVNTGNYTPVFIPQLGDDVTSCVDSNFVAVVLNAGNGFTSGVWSTGETTRQITANAPGLYVFKTTYECGVLADSVNVIGCPPDVSVVYAPNAFTPNGDGNNDTWMIYGKNITVEELSVFNRWGEKVFDGTGNGAAWDGVYRNTLQPVGLYVYYVQYVDLVDNNRRIKKGSFELIR